MAVWIQTFRYLVWNSLELYLDAHLDFKYYFSKQYIVNQKVLNLNLRIYYFHTRDLISLLLYRPNMDIKKHFNSRIYNQTTPPSNLGYVIARCKSDNHTFWLTYLIDLHIFNKKIIMFGGNEFTGEINQKVSFTICSQTSKGKIKTNESLCWYLF